MPRKQIAQIRYNLKDALNQIPHGQIKEARKELASVLGVSTTFQLWYYTSGKSQPNLPQAKAVEEYFSTKWGITDVWKAINPKTCNE